MYDIFDYLYWRGDLSFDIEPFNEIDNVIFARLSFLPLDNIVKEEITIKEAWNNTILLGINNYLSKKDKRLFKIIALSSRYKDLIIKNFVNKIDILKEEQFGALTIVLPNDTVYISYRGTDNTLVGFKEDLNMSFSSSLPSQKEAIKYLNNIKNVSKIIVGGHSKGGNLAIYASLFCNIDIKSKIIAIYNNDGPGFLKEITNRSEYKALEPIIYSYIPGSSFVGRLLNNSHNNIIVVSDNKFILQHDLYSWKISKNKFIHLDKLSKESIELEELLDNWLNQISYEERKEFVDIIYKIISSTNALTIDDLKINILGNIMTIINTYVNLNTIDKDLFIDILKRFIKCLEEMMIQNIKW